MKHSSVKAGFVALMLLGLMSFGSRAEAQAATIHSFHGCRLENLYSDADNPVTNKSSVDGRAVCDVGGRFSRSSPKTLYIDVIDRHPYNSILCFVYIRGWDGQRLYALQLASGADFMGHGVMQTNLPDDTLGYISMSCRVPTNVGQGESILIGYNLQ